MDKPSPMKRLGSSDSLALPGEEKGMYGRVFPTTLDGMDDDDCGDEELRSVGHAAGAVGEKKRRLSTDQVHALEKNFEVENKLDPDRKVRLAQELGLQPRQVAVWFQNRRARWKTKQLERDYAALKTSYDALLVDFDTLHHDKQTLLAEIKELKAKLGDEERFSSVKEEPEEVPVASESDVKASEAEEETPVVIYKDGPSDSDSSAVLNDDNATATAIATANLYSPLVNSSEPRAHKGGLGLGFVLSFQHQLLKAEEHGLEDPCSSFFADVQAPTLPWCCSDQWSWMDGGGENNIGKREGSM